MRTYVKMVSDRGTTEATKIEAEKEAAMKRRQRKKAKAAAAKATKDKENQLAVTMAQSAIAEETQRNAQAEKERQRNATDNWERAIPCPTTLSPSLSPGDTATEVEDAAGNAAEVQRKQDHRRDLVAQVNILSQTDAHGVHFVGN